ncbi:MAG: type II secretion system protein [Microcoleus sp. PH2017_10_PVI_O_A]|uniref:hormogonium polysaccharide secretion pseudopilin HpsB n=1 Tax=unclassified Microcoleus TaxID=2642155 RepID=UPI001D4FE9E6|nr:MULTISPECIES: hormogonium polysaccharide secretion pseudopilin HpsB [unclassified Microcoleus]TAE82479.1 MAG: type II secretion system protein [Oscillatoriales cyanobacterium]MCC3406166.1 type II secretion system protein [Microcoleus sp. PH2017_10_PVI_O_A]MCC3460757.1 type II secretion system protein [Microcoleus sp. PH2017_11_PCY_U_A]MCC3479319.1 type II secretion system protein [Microcoleus sp. PH2017_12_PCY_D_A]MCC3560160.1 type II secretion system protein [Microcoleus sp. PH2017_27_LUM_
MSEQKQHQNLSQSRDDGYTIIESLVAMIVVSVLMIAIAPVMAFSVATRVQARRVELATQAARAYIDALKPNPRTGDAAIKFGGSIPGFPTPGPTGDLADAPVPKNGTTLYCVDMDGEGCSATSSKDFYVQGAWKNTDVTTSDPTSKGYQLLVRVYRADSFAGVTLRPPKDAKQSVVGSGLGDKTIPVVEMSTEIPATGIPSHKSICNRLKTGTTVCP